LTCSLGPQAELEADGHDRRVLLGVAVLLDHVKQGILLFGGWDAGRARVGKHLLEGANLIRTNRILTEYWELKRGVFECPAPGRMERLF